MPSRWRVLPLSEVLTLKRGYDLPSQSRRHGEVPILGSFGVTGFHDEAKIKGPGVTIGRSGASIGVATFSEVDFWPLNTALYVQDFQGNEPAWVYWLLEGIDFSAYNSGSAQPSLNRNFLGNIMVDVPPLDEQRRISGVLGALDDLIEVNRRLMSDLRELAHSVVLRESESSENTKVLSDVADHKPGKYLAKDEYVAGGDYLVYGSNSTMGSHSRWLYEGPLLVLARIGSNCGNLTFSSSSCWVNNNASAIIPKSPSEAAWIHHALSLVDMSKHRLGSGQPFIGIEGLMQESITWPSAENCAALMNLSNELESCAAELQAEVMQLERVRDELLPLLMSGRLCVGDVAA